YHKAKQQTNREFYIIYFLPARLSQAIYLYLIYIQRLANLLYQEQNQAINVRLYRQLAIAITERYIREVYTLFNRYNNLSSSADRNTVFAWQSRHHLLQQETTYGLNKAYPFRVQPALLRAYK
ncbi:hypothetical protein DER46DRAFT_513661, partial [Fusarium sp. MPI-SDFR-AT-0072]